MHRDYIQICFCKQNNTTQYETRCQARAAMLWRVEGYVGGKGDLQRGEGQLDITSIELLFVANVCVCLAPAITIIKGSSLFGA